MPMKLLGPVGGGGQPRDRDRGGVGGDDRLRLQHRAEIVKDLALDLFLLDRGLDHQVAVGEPVHGLGGNDPVQRLLAGILGDDLLGDLARQIAVDGRHRRLQPVGGNVVEHHVEPGQRRHMRDAVAHLARADHADLLDHRRHLVISPGTTRAIAPALPCINTGRKSASSGRRYSIVTFRACRAPRSVREPPGRDPRPGRSRRPGRSARPRPC